MNKQCEREDLEDRGRKFVEDYLSNPYLDLEEERQRREEFEDILFERWKKPLLLLEEFIMNIVELNRQFFVKYNKDAEQSDDVRFIVLMRLHARACRIANGMLALMRSGYAEEALGRWRALHEVAVVAACISENGNDLSEKYLMHDAVVSYKLMRAQLKHIELVCAETISDELKKDIARKYESVLSCYGNNFSGDYGWASSLVKGNPNFVNIEKKMGMEHWRFYYKFASNSVHPSVQFLFKNLVSPDQYNVVSGASVLGLALPGWLLSLSISGITQCFISVINAEKYESYATRIDELMKDIKDAFQESNNFLNQLVEEQNGMKKEMIQITLKARESIESGWTQKALARNNKGFCVHPLDSGAVSWNIIGSFETDGDLVKIREAALKIIRDIVWDKSRSTLVRWNDDPNRTKEDVLEVFDIALERIGGKE